MLRLCRNVKWPLLGVTTVAVLVATYEQLRITYWPGLPPLDPDDSAYWAFRLSVFAMSLILSMRLGRAYDRWCELAPRGRSRDWQRKGAGHAGKEGRGRAHPAAQPRP